MSDSPAPKTRTITLTKRAPVTILEDDWPLIASARDWQGEHEFQSPRKWTLAVRQHKTDGRTLVYGVFVTDYQGEDYRRGGELLTPAADAIVPDSHWLIWPDIVPAIQRVGEYIGARQIVIDACVADLPAEVLE